MIRPRPDDLVWWCPRCGRVAEHRDHGAVKIERIDLPAYQRRQSPLWMPSQLDTN